MTKPKTRSNRYLTQFAVKKLQEYLATSNLECRDESLGNTRVLLQSHGDLDCLNFYLHGARICEIVFESGKAIDILILDGSFYDKAGNPSKTTRERLNGILDTLGQEGVIGDGIRAFIDKEDGICYVGRGTYGKPLGEGNETVALIPHPVKMTFRDTHTH
jgi:hypothetical protein